MTFQKIVKSPSSAEKIELPSPLRNCVPTEEKPLFHPLFKAVRRQASNSAEPRARPCPSRGSDPRSLSCKANAITTTPDGATHDGTLVHEKLIYVNFAAMVSETVCAEMLSRTCRSNLVGEVVHEKLSYVNLTAMVCLEMLSRTAHGK
ncbi:hypothetical protein AVEN_152264-1 [Araneus ventricosus]|uniref:Uncharacterized protein n=1 Tax=Araneus ventricosus TaxID=182803 RepID=A0A4Y2H9M7_ARAVE|nr:hypothetical protein AVEN_152264-1 [Araneus ventricosus]